MARVVDHSGARSATHNSLRQRPQGNASGGLASVGDLAKSKTKKRARPSTASAFSLLLIVFDKVGKWTRTNRPEARGQAGGTAYKTERYGIMGNIKKTRANGSTWNVLNLYLNYIRTEDYLTSGTDELNDKQGKIKKKSQNGCGNNLGSEREVPG